MASPSIATLQAVKHLHRHLQGLLRFGERIEPVRYVIDNATGRCVLAVHPDAIDVDSLTLHIPDEGDANLHLLARPTILDPARHESCDRFLIYFGPPIVETDATTRPTPIAPKWIMLETETAKHNGEMIDAADLEHPNPFRAAEPGACKRLNADPDVLRRACRHHGVDVPNPRLVGIDPWGGDVRAAFGNVRIEFDGAAAKSVDDAVQRINRME